jgi:hypothetical protein
MTAIGWKSCLLWTAHTPCGVNSLRKSNQIKFLMVTHQDDAVRRPSYECFNGARTSAASCRLEAVYRQLRYCWAMFTEHARTTVLEHLSLKHSSMTVSRKHATEPLESHHEQQRYAPCDMAFFSDRNP